MWDKICVTSDMEPIIADGNVGLRLAERRVRLC
jgi:hypothetical protein